jgi:hypothetical protein
MLIAINNTSTCISSLFRPIISQVWFMGPSSCWLWKGIFIWFFLFSKVYLDKEGTHFDYLINRLLPSRLDKYTVCCYVVNKYQTWGTDNLWHHSISKHGLETLLKSLFYLFVCVYAVFVHSARSINTLYFSIMNGSSNSNVSVQPFNHTI